VFVARTDLSTPEARARQRVKSLTDLLWHIGVFVVVNGFLWIQDIVAGGGVEYAYWTTIPWGFGLLMHVLAFFYSRRGLEERKYQEYLQEERAKETQLT
jgi:apolipoprotein N-acyltransferase